jgi:NADPH2:quinone reductase
MKAIVFHEFGGPEVLRYEEVHTPTPGTGEVLVQVRAVSVNRTLDLLVRQDNYNVRASLPHVLGTDPSGIVSEVGEGVEQPKVGDRVAVVGQIRCGQCSYCRAGEQENCLNTRHVGVHTWGGYAEYVTVPATNAVRLPDQLPFPEATVITRHFPTAFNLLNRAQLQAGDWVLVMGAAGALGSSLVQVARLAKAHVIAGAGADERVEKARSYGAEYGVNYRREDLAAEVMRITDGQGVNAVFENIADPSLWPGAFNSLAFRGRLLTAGAHGGGLVTLDVKRLYHRRLRIIGGAGSSQTDLQRAFEAASAGWIRAVIGRLLPLREAASAHRIVEENAVIGKVILEPERSSPDS